MNKTLYIPLIAAGIVVFGISGAMAKPDTPHRAGKEAATQAPHRMAPEVCPGMTPEKRAAVQAIMKEYRLAAGPLQDQLKAKRYELDALSRNPNTQPETLSKLAGEIGGLLGQIRTVKENRNGRLETELGFLPRHPDRLLGRAGGCPALMGNEAGKKDSAGAALPPAAPQTPPAARPAP